MLLVPVLGLGGRFRRVVLVGSCLLCVLWILGRRLACVDVAMRSVPLPGVEMR